MDGRREKRKIGGKKEDGEKMKIFRDGITLIFMSSTDNTE